MKKSKSQVQNIKPCGSGKKPKASKTKNKIAMKPSSTKVKRLKGIKAFKAKNVKKVADKDNDGLSIEYFSESSDVSDDKLPEDVENFISSLGFEKLGTLGEPSEYHENKSNKKVSKRKKIALKDDETDNAISKIRNSPLHIDTKKKVNIGVKDVIKEKSDPNGCNVISLSKEIKKPKKKLEQALPEKVAFKNKSKNEITKGINSPPKGKLEKMIIEKNIENDPMFKKCKSTEALTGYEPSLKKRMPQEKFNPAKLKLALQGTLTLKESYLSKQLKGKDGKSTNKDSAISTKGLKSTHEESNNEKLNKKSSKKDGDIKNNNPAATFKLKLLSQLNSASFRYLNEQLYTKTGAEAYEIFKKDKDAFRIYHEGYNCQLSQWPMNPRSIIAKWITKKPKNWIVADFGCGDGELRKKIPQKVISLDLVASSPGIIECDMAHTPLESASVDVVVFCLSLMGTNLREYFVEASRVLKDNGVLKIAEVESRFSSVDQFLKDLFKYGFKCIHKDQNHKYFYLFTLLKCQKIKKNQNLPSIELKPCIYKKR